MRQLSLRELSSALVSGGACWVPYDTVVKTDFPTCLEGAEFPEEFLPYLGGWKVSQVMVDGQPQLGMTVLVDAFGRWVNGSDFA